MTRSMVQLRSPSTLSDVEVSTTLPSTLLRTLRRTLSEVEVQGHSERWFDSLCSLTIVLSVIEARLKGIEG